MVLWALLKLTVWGTVGYLGWCVGFYFAFLVVWTLLKGTRPKHAERWMKYVDGLKRLREKSRGLAALAPLGYVMFVIFVCTMLVLGAVRSDPTVVTEHNVAIMARLNNGDFAYKSDEKPQGDTYRPCPVDAQSGIDVDGLLRQAVGYIAEHATWQERGTCRSILRDEWGFWWRDEANNFTYERTK